VPSLKLPAPCSESAQLLFEVTVAVAARLSVNGDDSGSTPPKLTDELETDNDTDGVTARLRSSKLARPLPSSWSRTVTEVVAGCVVNEAA